MESVSFKETTEGEGEGEGNPVLWVQFSCKDGSGASVSLNNIASDKTGVTGRIIRRAIGEYFQSREEKEV